MSETSYDKVPYTSTPFWQTHPDRLATIALLAGLDPAPLETARVLELGCAMAENLLPMALTFPDARIVGLDLSAKQIEAAREDAVALGLSNLELRHADVRDVDESWGEFDYVICHGVYSWVPPEAQEAILRVSAERLAPQGVAYVSYNTYPGWGLRRMIRDLMRYHTQQFTEPQVQIRQARAVLDYMVKRSTKDGSSPYGQLLAKELDLVRRCNDAYLYHEHLEDRNQPLYFHEFVEAARAVNLQVLGDAGSTDMTPWIFPARAQPGLSRDSEEWIRLEQYGDFLTNRFFRSSLLCHAERTLADQPPADVFQRLWVAAPDPTESGFETQPLAADLSPLTLAGLRALGKVWPQAVPAGEVYERAQAWLREAAGSVDPALEGEEARAALELEVVELYAATRLELRPRQLPFVTEVNERPCACPLARRQAERRLSYVTNRRHDAVTTNNYQRRLLRLLDGEHDEASLIDALVALARDDAVEVKEDDVVVTDPERLREIFAESLPTELAGFAVRALLIA